MAIRPFLRCLPARRHLARTDVNFLSVRQVWKAQAPCLVVKGVDGSSSRFSLSNLKYFRNYRGKPDLSEVSSAQTTKMCIALSKKDPIT